VTNLAVFCLAVAVALLALVVFYLWQRLREVQRLTVNLVRYLDPDLRGSDAITPDEPGK
jgi:hypothetical protein